MKLTKFEGNPILSPNPKNSWESIVATNPTAWYDEKSGEVLMVYRAAADDYEHTISLGLAKSKDGYHFERVSDKPFLEVSKEGGWDGGSVEDPRIIKFGDWFFLTYAAVPILPGRYWENGLRFVDKELPEEAPVCLKENKTRTGLLLTKDFKKMYRAGYMTDATHDDRDVIIFPEKINGKFVTLHRPVELRGEGYPNKAPAIWIAISDDLLEPKKYEFLAQARDEYDWEFWKVGGSTPPIKTKEGWLTLYHGVGKDGHYHVGAFLLDLNDPRKILHRTNKPILDPEFPFECEGIFKGICPYFKI